MSDDLVNRLLDRDFLYDWHVTDYERQSRMEAAAEAAAARILADAEVIKAAEELAAAVQAESDADGISLFMRDALAAYRKAQEKAKC